MSFRSISNETVIPKRVVIFRQGSQDAGKLIFLPETFEDLLSKANQKFKMDSKRIFSAQGGEIDDIELISDGDSLYISDGDGFSTLPARRVSSQSPAKFLGEDEDPVVNSTEWITLNVGGRRFTTTRATLTKECGSMLACMFGSDAEQPWLSSVDETGAFLIDRSPVYFEPILNYLRHGAVILDRHVNPAGVLEEARFFGIQSMVENLEARVKEDVKPDDHTPITRREFVFRLLNTPTNCELRCQGLNFAGADLTKLDLRYVNFKYAILREADLSGANLSYCNFERADLSHARLDNAILSGAKLLCVNLEHASLRKCNLADPAGSRTNLEGANLKHVDLEGSHMASVNLRVATLKNANLQNCDLRSAVLAGADLENCDLSGCDLHEANLRGANLKGATFELMLNPLHMSQTVP